jgi:hypothetical protein
MLIAALACIFSSCDLLNSKQDAEIEKKIDDKVKEANAPHIKVEVNEHGMGVASPRGNLSNQVKLDIPFTLTYSSYTEYGFLSWQAWLASDPGTLLPSNKVEFSPADNPETTVTVHFNPGSDKVVIAPAGGLAPVPVSITPSIEEGIVFADRVIRIRFSKPIDPDSFGFEEDWKKIYYPEEFGVFPDDELGGYDNRVYTNITMPSSQLDQQGQPIDFMRYYYPPVLSTDGYVLTLWRKIEFNTNELAVFTYNQITLLLNRDIRSSDGIAMGKTYPFVIEQQGTERNWGIYWRSEDNIDGLKDMLKPPKLLSWNFMGIKAKAPDAARPDGEIMPEAVVFSGSEHDGPSLPPYDHSDHGHADFFEDPSAENWIYLVFQTDFYDYPIQGALVYESRLTDANEQFAYTGKIASLVHDPAIVQKLAKEYSDYYSDNGSYSPSRPIHVVKYQLATYAADDYFFYGVNLVITPIDILDVPRDAAYTGADLRESHLLDHYGDPEMGAFVDWRSADQKRIESNAISYLRIFYP